MLLKRGKAATERMTPRIDDLCVGQNEVNKPHIKAVIRHLIDEEWRRRLAMDAGRMKIPLTKGAQAAWVERDQSIEKTSILLLELIVPIVRTRQFARNLRDVRQLHGALDQ